MSYEMAFKFLLLVFFGIFAGLLTYRTDGIKAGFLTCFDFLIGALIAIAVMTLL